MCTAKLNRSVYLRFGGGYYSKGECVYVESIDIENDRIIIKRLNYEGPIRTQVKLKDITPDVRWINLG